MPHAILAVTNLLNLNFVTTAYMFVVNTITKITIELRIMSNIRHTKIELSKLSDRELRDMGISRGMIDEIAESAYRG